MAEVLVIGATSMVGSHFVQHGGFRCAAIGRRDPRTSGLSVERFDPVDLEDPLALHRRILQAPEAAVVNFAAITDVDGVEPQRPADLAAASGSAWNVNALAPAYVAHGADESGKQFVQISTDFVFDGEAGPYDETASRSPFSPRISWYGWTKGEGERRTAVIHPSSAILRIAYPYRAGFPAKVDFARRMLLRYRDGTLPPLFTDQQISPTWIPDVTAAVGAVIRRRYSGFLHVASPDLTNPHEFGTELITRAVGHPVEIPRGSLPPAGPGRAPRPPRGGLRSVRAPELGLTLTSWRSGIAQLLRSSESAP